MTCKSEYTCTGLCPLGAQYSVLGTSSGSLMHPSKNISLITFTEFEISMHTYAHVLSRSALKSLIFLHVEKQIPQSSAWRQWIPVQIKLNS